MMLRLMCASVSGLSFRAWPTIIRAGLIERAWTRFAGNLEITNSTM